MDSSLKPHSCVDTLLEPQGFTSLEVTAVLSLTEKDFSSWIPVTTDSPQICRSPGHFRVLRNELFFIQSCLSHVCISSVL